MRLAEILANETSAAVIFGRIHARNHELDDKMSLADGNVFGTFDDDDLDDFFLIRAFFSLLAKPYLCTTIDQSDANRNASADLTLAAEARERVFTQSTAVGNTLACRVMGITNGGYTTYARLTERPWDRHAA